MAVEELGIPSIVLMENAGRSATEVGLDQLAAMNVDPAAARAAVVCGGGNNGGDGYVVARHLHNAGVGICLYSAKPPGDLVGDALVNQEVVRRMGLPQWLVGPGSDLSVLQELSRVNLVVDALLGTGFQGTIRPEIARLIDAVNVARSPRTAVLALDIPSGLDCDSGRAARPTVVADVTVSFVGAKLGFGEHDAAAALGRVVVGDIGVPTSLVEKVLGR